MQKMGSYELSPGVDIAARFKFENQILNDIARSLLAVSNTANLLSTRSSDSRCNYDVVDTLLDLVVTVGGFEQVKPIVD